jgi:hypothetical protein
MKKYVWMLVVVVGGLLPVQSAQAQSAEMTQLILNLEKLAEFKKILQTMKQYYDILTTGYNAVRDMAKGNFSLHKVFLDGLLEVSPEVKKYRRIVDIVAIQLQLIKEYKVALKRTRASNLLNEGELDYLERVYGQLINRSVDNLNDLITVITAQQLRMSDEERLAAIDQIFKDMSNKLEFLRHFNNETSVLLLQRKKEQTDAEGLDKILDVNK